MKKLRLIKPWRLSAVRQSLEYGVCAATGERMVSCSGPASDAYEAMTSRNMPANSRVCSSPDGRSENRTNPPFSDVIFVLSTNTRIR